MNKIVTLGEILVEIMAEQHGQGIGGRFDAVGRLQQHGGAHFRLQRLDRGATLGGLARQEAGEHEGIAGRDVQPGHADGQ